MNLYDMILNGGKKTNKSHNDNKKPIKRNKKDLGEKLKKKTKKLKIIASVDPNAMDLEYDIDRDGLIKSKAFNKSGVKSKDLTTGPIIKNNIAPMGVINPNAIKNDTKVNIAGKVAANVGVNKKNNNKKKNKKLEIRTDVIDNTNINPITDLVLPNDVRDLNDQMGKMKLDNEDKDNKYHHIKTQMENIHHERMEIELNATKKEEEFNNLLKSHVDNIDDLKNKINSINKDK